MGADADSNALRAVGDKLVDTGELYAAASRAATSAAVKARLAKAAQERVELGRSILEAAGISNNAVAAAGTPFVLLDKLRLKVDEWTGDENDAAVSNSTAADHDLSALISDCLRDPELRERTRSLLQAVKTRLPASTPPPMRRLSDM